MSWTRQTGGRWLERASGAPTPNSEESAILFTMLVVFAPIAVTASRAVVSLARAGARATITVPFQ